MICNIETLRCDEQVWGGGVSWDDGILQQHICIQSPSRLEHLPLPNSNLPVRRYDFIQYNKNLKYLINSYPY